MFQSVVVGVVLLFGGKCLAAEYRIITGQTATGGAFSSDFLSALSADFTNNGTSNSTNSTAADTNLSLNRTYAGASVPVDVYSVSSSSNVNASNLCAALTSTSSVGYCEVDVQVSTDVGAASPDDTLLPQQWDMPHVTAPTAWANGFTGTPLVRVCMIDTGVDYTHPDLVGNLWVNPAEAAGAGATSTNSYKNGIDDDGDGIIDDIYGASFVNGAVSGDPMDQNGHGTFVAGVVGAVGNNGKGVTGMNQAISIIACQFMDATGNGWVSDAIQCIDYCISKDAHIMSNSWGGVAYSQALQTAIDSAQTHGALFVASAGNDGVNTDITAHYPSSMNNSIVLSVGASDSNDNLWTRSNYGKSTVHVAAPGVSVLNLGLAGLYVKMTGTSMATPHVSGAAALILQKFLANGWPITTTGNQGLGVQIKQLIESSAVSMGTAASAKLAAGLLDTWAAIQLVPIPASSSGSSSSFGDTPESSTTTPSTPEEANPFSSSSATQSQDFENADVTGTNNVSSPSPVSASDQLIATAIQQTAAVSLNTTVNTTKPMFGNTQAVVFTSSGDAVAPATSALNTSLGTAHIEAPSSAPKALVAPAAAPKATSKAAVQQDATKNAGSGRKAIL